MAVEVTAGLPPPSAGRAATAALARTQQLLTGPGRGQRWKALVVLAAMAGLVGAGAAPPPLGLLQPVWRDPNLHHTVFDHPGVVAALVGLALFLLLMGGFGRSFTLGFLEGLKTGAPDLQSYRRHLRAGIAHFVWSSAATVPLYLLLFLGEAVVAHGTLEEITRLLGIPSTSDTELFALVLGAGLKFLLVLVPWTLVTLPIMVVLYELVPAVMIQGRIGARPAFRRVHALVAKHRRPFVLYLALRYLMQLLGNLASLLALLPCLLVGSPVWGVLLAGGWQLCRRLGGPGSAGGAAILTVCVLFAAVVVYATLCAALLPVSTFINEFALQFVGECERSPDRVVLTGSVG